MDELVVMLVVQKTLKRVLSLFPHELLLRHAHLKQIQDSLTFILAALHKIEAHSKMKHDMPIIHKLIMLKQAAHDAEDALDDLAYANLKQQVSYSDPSSHFSKLNSLNQSLLEIRNEMMRFSLQYASSHRIIPTIDLDGVRGSVPDDAVVVGRESDVSMIVNLLFLSSDQRILTVVPIEGVDGLGKTTLARLVCQYVMPLNLFDVQIWVSCSQVVDLKNVLIQMLQSLNRFKTINYRTNKDVIIRKLEKELARKKFLLVLDDVWTDVSGWWAGLKNLLLKISAQNGNVVLVTTRFEQVVPMVDPSSQHRHIIEPLSRDVCWCIMKDRAFRNVTASIPSNLEFIGFEIVKKCSGVPLAAKVIGGVMGINADEKTWLNIIDRKALDYTYDYRGVQRLMVQSFDQLPTPLKHCFTLCSVYPEGYSISKEELIHLWTAEGFADSFEQGNKYFNALLGNSFFQDVERSDDGDVILCKMHDIMHQFAYSLLKYEIRSSISPSATGAFGVRHLFVNNQSSVIPMLLNDRAEKLCSVILDHVPSHESWKLTSLRTLSFNGTSMKKIPSFTGKLKHLRYLRVSNTKTRALPKFITKLCHLQTLNLSYSMINSLPESISKLHSLQTLNVSNSKLRELSESITKLYHLQSLKVSKTNIKELPKRIGELQNLQMLDVSKSNIRELPESISRLQNLQTLNVSNCSIKKFPESITNLRKLQTLQFLKCKELHVFPRKEIHNLVNLKNISFSYEHQMPFGLRHLTCLQTLPFFVVGPNSGGSIADLGLLNELRGNLKITKLEEVQDMEEATRANTKGKTRIQGLGLQWSYGSNDRIYNDEELLERLQPNPSIEKMKIKYYMGEKWPLWMLLNTVTVLNNVVNLTLEHCWNNAGFPFLGDLPYLKYLKINHMGKVKCIDNDFYGINIAGNSNRILKLFPSLKSLSVSWMENLTHWSSPSDGDRVVSFPCLEILSIQYCAKLTNFPFSDLSALVKIELEDCEQLRLELHEQQSFLHLTSLYIEGCPKLTYLRNWLLSKRCYREVKIQRCQWLMFVQEDLGMLSSLTSLEIYCCKRLRCFSERILCGLTQLKHLSIGAFAEELDDFHYLNRIQDLPWLEEIDLWGSDFIGREMALLPNQLQHLTGLKSLKIMGFASMEALPLWLMNLQSLKSISLSYCRNLKCQSTAAILQQISNLEYLFINCCPELQKSKSEWLKSLNSKRTKVEFSLSSLTRRV